MDAFKRVNFERAHPGAQFPELVAADRALALDLRARLARRLGMLPSADGLTLVQAIARRSTLLDGVDAQATDFDLRRVLRALGIPPAPKVLINWYRLDDLDEIAFDALVERFQDLWYPGSDDIEILDETCDWIVSISHTGDVRYLDLRQDVQSKPEPGVASGRG